MPDTNETFTERVDVTTQPDGAFIGTLEIDAPTTGREADHQEELNEAIEVGHGRSDPLVTHAKMLGLELPKVKADLEPELEDFSLNCSKCGLDVQWGHRLGISAWSLGAPGARAARGAGGQSADGRRAADRLEEDRTLRAVLVGMLREAERGSERRDPPLRRDWRSHRRRAAVAAGLRAEGF